LGLLATITHEVLAFRMYAPLTALLPLFNCILEVVFCEGVQHRLPQSPQFCQNDDIQFYL
jgi:hypothetical protein